MHISTAGARPTVPALSVPEKRGVNNLCSKHQIGLFWSHFWSVMFHLALQTPHVKTKDTSFWKNTMLRGLLKAAEP